jgi:hypothetical protein
MDTVGSIYVIEKGHRFSSSESDTVTLHTKNGTNSTVSYLYIRDMIEIWHHKSFILDFTIDVIYISVILMFVYFTPTSCSM